jgi:hypothetical protein
MTLFHPEIMSSSRGILFVCVENACEVFNILERPVGGAPMNLVRNILVRYSIYLSSRERDPERLRLSKGASRESVLSPGSLIQEIPGDTRRYQEILSALARRMISSVCCSSICGIFCSSSDHVRRVLLSIVHLSMVHAALKLFIVLACIVLSHTPTIAYTHTHTHTHTHTCVCVYRGG